MSASRTSYAGNYTSLNSPTKTSDIYRPYGCCIRPVLKELKIYPYAEKKDIITDRIDKMAVDLGITKTVTENGEQVTYKLLWSPFNYGVESKIDLKEINQVRNMTDDEFIDNCNKNPGMRLAWGDTEERDENTKFTFEGYANSNMAQGDYNKNNSPSTDKDTRDLKPEDDIVQCNWPDGWSIPTARDLELLAEHTIVKKETDAGGKTWFRLTAKNGNGNSILIPGTGYIDSNYNKETWNPAAYLQSSTMGINNSTVTGEITGNKVTKRLIYAINISGTAAKVVDYVGRATGIMVRPVKYVRVQ